MATKQRFILVLLFIGLLLAGFIAVSLSRDVDHTGPAGNTMIKPARIPVNNTSNTAVQSFSGPAGKYVYMVTIIAPHGGHVITGEYLLNNRKGMKEWRFAQYENNDIQPGDWQMPYGNATQKTIVEIHKVTNFSVVGNADLVVDGEVFPVEFFIDDKGNITEDGNFAPVDCYTGIPFELAGKLVLLKTFGRFGISNCTADLDRKVFSLTVYNVHDPVALSEFQSLKPNGWTVRIGRDIGLEQSLLEMHDTLHQIKMSRPELRISAYGLIVDSRKRPVQKIAEVFVTEMTPENRALDGTEINGWKIRVLELYELKRGDRQHGSR
jgi:hypothetical protein